MKLFSLLGLALVVVTTVPGADSRRWNDTGTGTIVFEEAWTIPALIGQNAYAEPYTVYCFYSKSSRRLGRWFHPLVRYLFASDRIDDRLI